jgi:replication-associated recombination protein RarA
MNNNEQGLLLTRFTGAYGKHAPLAERMRPRTLAEFTGQEHCWARAQLERMIANDNLSS